MSEGLRERERGRAGEREREGHSLTGHESKAMAIVSHVVTSVNRIILVAGSGYNDETSCSRRRQTLGDLASILSVQWQRRHLISTSLYCSESSTLRSGENRERGVRERESREGERSRKEEGCK